MKTQEPQGIDNITKKIFDIMNSYGGTNGIHDVHNKHVQIKMYQSTLAKDGMPIENVNQALGKALNIYIKAHIKEWGYFSHDAEVFFNHTQGEKMTSNRVLESSAKSTLERIKLLNSEVEGQLFTDVKANNITSLGRNLEVTLKTLESDLSTLGDEFRLENIPQDKNSTFENLRKAVRDGSIFVNATSLVEKLKAENTLAPKNIVYIIDLIQLSLNIAARKTKNLEDKIGSLSVKDAIAVSKIIDMSIEVPNVEEQLSQPADYKMKHDVVVYISNNNRHLFSNPNETSKKLVESMNREQKAKKVQMEVDNGVVQSSTLFKR